jgi:hypothetical protein
MNESLKVECQVHFRRRDRGRKELHAGAEPPRSVPEAGRVPRVCRLLALAIRFEGLVRAGEVASYADLARLGHVTPARVSQVMSLLYLAPDLQEEILFLPRTRQGRDPILLRELLPIAATLEWKKQRRMWADLSARTSAGTR